MPRKIETYLAIRSMLHSIVLFNSSDTGSNGCNCLLGSRNGNLCSWLVEHSIAIIGLAGLEIESASWRRSTKVFFGLFVSGQEPIGRKALVKNLCRNSGKVRRSA